MPPAWRAPAALVEEGVGVGVEAGVVMAAVELELVDDLLVRSEQTLSETVEALTASSAEQDSEMQPITTPASLSCFSHMQVASVTSQPTLGAPSLIHGVCGC